MTLEQLGYHSVIVMVTAAVFARAEYLFRVSPGGDGIEAAGLWGGHVTLAQNGRADDLHTHGYAALNTSYTSYHGIQIQYASYDAVTKRTLLVVDDPHAASDSTQHALAIGSLCEHGHNTLDASFQNFKLVDDVNSNFLDADCGWRCGWGPFAFYDNKIYFVLSAVFGEHFSQLQREIQIRVIDGCDDVIDAMRDQARTDSVHEFPVLRCSTRLATLYTAQYRKPSPVIDTWTSSELKLVHANGLLHFFTQLISTDDATQRLDLYHAFNDSAHVLSSVEINTIYAGNLRPRGFGSVDFNDGVLCWTTGQTLHCGLYELDALRPYVVPILKPGRAVSENICLPGSITQEELQHTVTGVAISETDDTLSVYFGCYADLPASGGVGLIRVSRHGLDFHLYPVMTSQTRIYGGSLFIAEGDLDDVCRQASMTSSPFVSREAAMSQSNTELPSSDDDAVVSASMTATSTESPPDDDAVRSDVITPTSSAFLIVVLLLYTCNQN